MITIGFLAEWALRSSILILSGTLLIKVLRVKDPSVRLAAWTAMLCASVAIPLLSVSLPAMPVKAAPVTVFRNVVQPSAAPAAPSIAVFRSVSPAAPRRAHFDWVIIYFIVTAALFLRLCFGLAFAARLLHRSWPTELDGVRESGHITSPVTVGILRPAILLPVDWREWELAKLDAVLAHERSHIRRRDPAVQVLSAIHRALLWYSPLSWYLDRQIVRLAEEASDDAAVAAVCDRAAYAETLLAFMQRAVGRPNWQGVPMARYGSPEGRIHRILDATTLSRGVTRWSIAAILMLGMPLAYVIAAAQERPTFEAASVKPAVVPEGVVISGNSMSIARREDMDRYRGTGGPGTSDPGRIHYPLVSLKGLLERAYRPAYFEITAPSWTDTDVVSVDATMSPDTTKEQFQRMLQNLLVDRFQLKSHIDTKDISGYALVVTKNGPKLKEATEAPPADGTAAAALPKPRQVDADGWPTPPRRPGLGFMYSGMPGERARMMGEYRTMADLATELGRVLDSKVIDATGLTARYDITLTYAGHLGGPHGVEALRQAPEASADPSAPTPLPDIFSALQSQLGLKLEPKKVPVEILVVDHAEKTPTGN